MTLITPCLNDTYHTIRFFQKVSPYFLSVLRQISGQIKNFNRLWRLKFDLVTTTSHWLNGVEWPNFCVDLRLEIQERLLLVLVNKKEFTGQCGRSPAAQGPVWTPIRNMSLWFGRCRILKLDTSWSKASAISQISTMCRPSLALGKPLTTM